MTKEDVIQVLTNEQETTVRFQIVFGVGGIIVSLVAFWAASQFSTVDLRYGFLFVCVLIAISWFKESAFLLLDVFINILKMKEKI